MNRLENVGPDRPWLVRADSFVKEAFARAGNPLVVRHLKRTVDWLRELKPAADEALVVAALVHDIERAFREEEVYARMFTSPMAFRDPAFLDYHQQRSARIIGDFLAECGAPEDFRIRVCALVARHEVGGDPESDLLKDADSLSFFEVNTDLFVTVKVKEAGLAAVAEKFDWMYARISGARARKLCRPLYEQARARLTGRDAAGSPLGG